MADVIEDTFSEEYAEVASALRLYNFAQRFYHDFIDRHSELVSHELNVILYRELVRAIREEVKGDAYELLSFAAVAVKDHPDLAGGEREHATA